MRPPPYLCYMSVRIKVKCGMCGVLDTEVSFDSWIVMMPGLCCVYEMFEFLHGAPYAICVELKYFFVCVFCFGGILFVSCVTVCGCGWGGGWWV